MDSSSPYSADDDIFGLHKKHGHFSKAQVLSKTADRKHSMDAPPKLRIVLLGKNELDNGRVGNLILGRDAFQTEAPEVSEEHLSERVRGQVEGRPITLINTPDLFNPQLTPHELSVAVEECVYLSDPGPHVFILVLQPDSFTEEDRNKVKAILNSFSDEAMNYTIVLTTVRSARHISASYTGEKEDPLGLIIKECKMRHHIFDKIYRFDQSQVLKLLEKIDQMVEENGGSYLTCEKTGEIPGGSLLPKGKHIMKRERGSDSHEGEETKKKKKGEIAAIQQAQGIMVQVQHKLEEKIKHHAKANTKFINYIRGIIADLHKKTIQKTTVGVFGKTGDGKSSLINAILDETELLPTGTLEACTSVIIQVEAGTERDQYTATIEFISKEAWQSELKSLIGFLAEEERDETICKMAEDKIEALYGKNAAGKSFDELMKDDRSPFIAELLRSTTKIVSCFQASDLSEEIRPFIQHHESDLGRLYWPLVKTVRIKVPNHKELLENVVLVDLPGNGDCNQTRDEMWKSMLRECTAVWVVSDINRAVADKAAWEILNSSMTDMVQGGACTSITFICTKTDNMDPQSYMRSLRLKNEDLQITVDNESERKRKCIQHRNNMAKDRVKRAYERECQLQKYYIRSISVFTVSSREFCSKDSCLKQEDTEIPSLREVLRSLNHSHTNRVAAQYLTSATGILSLIQTSKDNNAEMNIDKSKLHTELKRKLEDELRRLSVRLEPCYCELEKCLSDGVEKSEMKCAEITKKKVDVPAGKDGRGYHQTLSALCRNKGYFRSNDGETRDLNKSLAEVMYESINKEYNALFPNEGKTGQSVLEKIDEFSICCVRVAEGYSNPAAMTHILNFLKTEEAKLKQMFQKLILQQKREMYASITDTIREEMIPGYIKAEECVGTRSMLVKQRALIQHAESLKHTMFNKAKSRMLDLFRNLMKLIEIILRDKLLEAMAHALTESNTTFSMDVSSEIEKMETLSVHI